MTIYLGPLGNLQALPSIGRDIAAPLDLGAAVQQALSGARTVDYIGDPKRSYSMQRRLLLPSELAILEGLAIGAYGPGPYVLIEPWRENLLTAQQSSGTNTRQDASEFFAAAGTISSSTAVTYLRPRCLAWAVTALNQELATGSKSPINQADTLKDVPVLPGALYRASVRARTAAASGTSLYCTIRWFDVNGLYLSDTVSALTPLNNTDWTRVQVSGVAPAGAALARVRVVDGAFTSATTIYTDAWCLSMLDTSRDNLALNPTAEDASGVAIVRTNLVFNPIAVSTGTAGWQAVPGTGGTAGGAYQTGQSGWAGGMSTSYRVTWTVATSAVSGGVMVNNTVGTRFPVTAGKTYCGFVQLRCSKAQRMALRIDWYDAGGAFLSSTLGNAAVTPVAPTPTSKGVDAAVAPVNAVSAQMVLEAQVGTSGTTWAIGDWVEATRAQFEETDVGLINGLTSRPLTGTFWGSVANPGGADVGEGNLSDYTIAYAGTADQSVSVMSGPALSNYVAGATAGVVSTRSTDRAAGVPGGGTYTGRILWPTATANAAGDAQTIGNLVVGRTYWYSRWVYVPAGSPDVRLSIDSMTWASTGGSGPGTSLKDQWVYLVGSFIATSTSHVFRIINSQASVKGDDRVYWDNMSVLAAPPGDDVSMPAEVTGTGSPRVAFTSWTDSYPIIPLHDVAFELVEVG